MKKIRRVPIKIVLSFLWILLIVGTGIWILSLTKRNHEDQLLTIARSNFNLIVTSRDWNAEFGGVYVPVTENSQPNPYLDLPERDITLSDGRELTLINPAYMTRMISELSAETNGLSFHITSLKPIRPQNQAQPWEIEALRDFENDQDSEYSYYDSATHTFHYMAPLITKQECLKCHEQQGYQVGDIRGGISVSFPTSANNPWPIVISLSVIGLTGFMGILKYSSTLDTRMDTLQEKAQSDSLTGIPNRAYFESIFQKEYARASRNRSPLSLIFCDIDLFKQYNDHYGHQFGDFVLQKTARTLREALNRPADVLARYGGEEFIALLPDTDQAGALYVAEKMRQSIEDLQFPHPTSPVSPHLTISAGVFTYQGQDLEMAEVLEKADQALYQAKKKGRNQVCC